MRLVGCPIQEADVVLIPFLAAGGTEARRLRQWTLVRKKARCYAGEPGDTWAQESVILQTARGNGRPRVYIDATPLALKERISWRSC